MSASVGGSANEAGTRFEQLIATWAAVCILAGDRAAPLPGLTPNTSLVAIRRQTGAPLDDLRLHASDGTVVDIQAKRTLPLSPNAASEFGKTIGQIVAHGRPSATAAAGSSATAIIAVGSSTGAPVRQHLRVLLDRVRMLDDGRTLDELAGELNAHECRALHVTRNLIAHFWPESNEHDQRALFKCTHVHMFAVEPNQPDETRARDLLRQVVLLHPSDDETTWRLLRTLCGDAGVLSGGLSRDTLRERLAAARIALLPEYPSGPFITPGEFFRPFLDTGRPFNHTWALVGREGELTTLREFVADASRRILLLVARGGGGKSRLLRAIAEDVSARVDAPAFLFAREGVAPDADAPRFLPNGRWLLAVDDAHRRTADVNTFLALAREAGEQGRLILTTRPHYLDALRAQLTEAGIDSRTVVEVELADLGPAALWSLAAQALGPGDNPALVEQLAHLGSDSPLVITVAGRLFRAGRVQLSSLVDADVIRGEVFARFADFITGQVSVHITPERCQHLLRLIAALGPDHLDEGPLAAEAAAFLGCTLGDYREALRRLEDAGSVLRRGRLLRLAPDLLADFLLREACVDRRGRSLGYGERLFAHLDAAGLDTTRLLVNLAETDSGVAGGDPAATGILPSIWPRIQERFRGAGYLGRMALLGEIRPLATLQPVLMVGLLELARADTTPGEDPDYATAIGVGRQSLLHKIPPLLGDIARAEPEIFQRSVDLLWELGREDIRPINSHTGHALRVLVDLANHDGGAPPGRQLLLVDAVERWLGEDQTRTHAHLALAVLLPLVEKVGEGAWSNGASIGWSSFPLEAAATAPARARALAIAYRYLDTTAPTVCRAALAILFRALDDWRLRNVVGDDEAILGAWHNEQLTVLTRLLEFGTQTDESAIHLLLAREVLQHTRDNPAPAIREGADKFVALLDTFPGHLTRALDPYWTPDVAAEEVLATEGEDRYNAYGKAVAQELVATFTEPTDGLGAVNACYRSFARWQGVSPSGLVLGALADVDAEYAFTLAERLIAAPEQPAAASLGDLLASLRAHDAGRAVALARAAAGGGHPVACVGVARAYGQRWAMVATPEEALRLTGLLAHPSSDVRRLAIQALGPLLAQLPEGMGTLAQCVDIGDDTDVAESLACQLVAGDSDGLASLGEGAIEAIIERLRPLTKATGYCLGQLLSIAAARVPEAVVAFLLARVTDSVHRGREDYVPFPHRKDLSLAALAASPQYAELLRQIRDASIGVSWPATEWLGDLYAAASQCFDETGLAVLTEWIARGTSEQLVAVATLIEKAPRNVVFDQADFVSLLVEAAAVAGEGHFQRIERSLSGSANRGIRVVTPGQPSQEDVAVRDRVTAHLGSPGLGVATRRFYGILRDQAVARIEAAVRDGQEPIER